MSSSAPDPSAHEDPAARDGLVTSEGVDEGSVASATEDARSGADGDVTRGGAGRGAAGRHEESTPTPASPVPPHAEPPGPGQQLSEGEG